MTKVAEQMFAECVDEEQSTRVVRSDAEAKHLRDALRRLARAARVKVRTAHLDDAVIVVRLDAAVWNESTEVMRQKLMPATKES